jgi:hypothetical protein
MPPILWKQSVDRDSVFGRIDGKQNTLKALFQYPAKIRLPCVTKILTCHVNVFID